MRREAHPAATQFRVTSHYIRLAAAVLNSAKTESGTNRGLEPLCGRLERSFPAAMYCNRVSRLPRC